MRFFQKFFEQFKQQDTKVIYKVTDKRKAKCPYCGEKLKKVPGRKTKCPHCNQFMYIRTRPKDKVRIVATKKQADKIDEEWIVITGTHDEYLVEKEELEKEKEILKKRFGKEPSENDVKWGVFNKQWMEHAKNNDWGLYRNTRFGMAELLRKEMKLKQALQTYLEVCYLDLNEPNNFGGINDPELLKEFPPFNPKHFTSLAPAIIDYIKRIAKKLELQNNEIKQLFIEHNKKIGQSLRLPLLPEQCWDKIEKELSKLNF